MPYEAVENIGNGITLVFAPHPDDEVFGCGGAIMRHVADGDPVHVVIVSNGGFLGEGDASGRQAYIDVRRQESTQAAGMLGYGEPVFWELPDRGIIYGEALVQRVLDCIEATGAEVVYAPSVFEMHPDHRALGMIVTEAVRRCNRNITLAMYEIGVPLHPNRLLDITDMMERKQQAMQCFASQLKVQDYDQQIDALNRFRTYTLPKNVKAAEAYLVKSREELQSCLPELYASEFERQKELGLEIDSGQSPLVTVIIRSIGRGKLLHEALDSVALQTYPNIEVLIVNAKGEGHPEPGKWCGRFPLRMVGTDEPLARSKAANVGLDNAKGEYLIFLDDDDLFDPDHIFNLVGALEGTPDKMVAYTGVESMGGEESLALPVYNSPYSTTQLRLGNYIPMHAAMFSRNLVKAGCQFDEGMDLYEDWDFWLQLSQRTKFIHVNHVSAIYRISGNSGISGIQEESQRVQNARFTIYKKWKNKWSDEDYINFMQTVKELNHEVVKRDGQISTLNEAVSERDGQISALNEAVSERDGQISALNEAVSERDGQISALQAAVANRNAVIGEIWHSTSWKLTVPVRFVGRQCKRVGMMLGSSCRRMAALSFAGLGRVWRFLPLSTRQKRAIKHMIFTMAPFLVSNTSTYKHWLEHAQTESTGSFRDGTGTEFVPAIEQASFVARLSADAIPLKPQARLIAFYLPQFHPIPENNEWWGDGFTEWTSVRSAQPLFEGHYQPHVPVEELGYYNLTDVEVMRRQAELAMLYGVGGFCFYFYWFGGKRLLETPIQNYLEQPDIDFPFCLCWANENWSRRWDGLEQEVLIAQSHSESDDMAFIEHVSRYMRDKRYIRIAGKPLLLIYRPALLPDTRTTARRWRAWCLQHGIGEIYLAYTQSFEKEEPAFYGFDAAIEFPPNNSHPPDITDHVSVSEDFGGTVFDWRVFPDRSNDYQEPGYALYRGVNPAWDNTARRKSNGHIFYGSSPLGYQQWLFNALQDTVKRFPNPEERILFVNAWNEWAEGAHLEPDERYGYGYLEATRMAFQRLNAASGEGLGLSNRVLAIVVHAFYVDVLEEMLIYLSNMGVVHKLYVTTPFELEGEVRQLLEQYAMSYHLLLVQNSGRDVLPFLKIIPAVLKEKHGLLLKLHTKKSKHRKDGNVWRNDIFDKLLLPENASLIIDKMIHDPDVGMVGPEGHIVAMTTYWGSNKSTVLRLANRMGVNCEQVMSHPFVAGTMFYARISALNPLLNLALNDGDFEKETGQVDGTMAHSIERLFSVSSVAAGLKLISSDWNDEKNIARVNEKYGFASSEMH